MLFLAIFLASVATVTWGEDVTVNLSKGKLRGARLDYDFGQYYYAFKGIPYARPPVKELRFKVLILALFFTIFPSFCSHFSPEIAKVAPSASIVNIFLRGN